MTAREVLEAALALPADERAELVRELEATLPATVDDATLALINERAARVHAGEPGIPAAEAFAHLRQR